MTSKQGQSNTVIATDQWLLVDKGELGSVINELHVDYLKALSSMQAMRVKKYTITSSIMALKL